MEIAKKDGDLDVEGRALGNLGSTNEAIGEYDKAIAYLKKSLTIARSIGDRARECSTLESLATVYEASKVYQEALDCNQKSHIFIFRRVFR